MPIVLSVSHFAVVRRNDKRFTTPASIKFGYGSDVEGGWDSVTDESREHQAWDIPSDMFRDWGPDISGEEIARM